MQRPPKKMSSSSSCPTRAYYAQLSERVKRMPLGDMRAVMSLLHEAQLKLPLNVVALVPAVENMPSGRATKPGDIVRARIVDAGDYDLVGEAI